MCSIAACRSSYLAFVATLLLAGPLGGGLTSALVADEPVTKAVVPATPSDLHRVHWALREFDRFLDHHPLLEADLRLDPTRSRDSAYLQKNPDLVEFLAANPDVPVGLKIYPRYFLYRALLRQASEALRYSEVGQLKEVLDQEPALEQALARNPEAIRESVFVQTHPSLRDFLTRHPTLGEAFASLPPDAGKKI